MVVHYSHNTIHQNTNGAKKMSVIFSLIPKSISKVLLISLLPVVSFSQAAQKCDQDSLKKTPTSRFTVNADQTVLDTESQLVWKQCPQGLTGESCGLGKITGHTWEDALSIAEEEDFAGETDWRLPDMPELLSIVEDRCINPAVNLAVFPIDQNWFFWSSRPHAENANTDTYTYVYSNASSAWGVDSYSVKRSSTTRDITVHGAVRLVRAGRRF